MPDFILSNGFKTIYHRDTTNPLVSLQIFVRMGTSLEHDDEAGYSHCIEHMVFKRTEKFPDSSLSDRAAYLGALLNAYTEYDSTCYYLTLPSEHIDAGLDLLAELVRHSNFDENDFRAERKVIVEEIKQCRNEPEDFFIEEIARRYFHVCPFGNPILGTEASLRKATWARLREFYRRHYCPERCFLVAVGDFEPERLQELVESLFGDWAPGIGQPPAPPNEVYPTSPSLTVVPGLKDLTQDMLAFVIPELGDRHPDTHALSMATKILAYGKESRLYDRLFYREQAINALRIHSYGGVCDGISIILMEPRQNTDPNHLVAVFLEELQRIYDEGVPKSDLRKLTDELTHAHRYSFEFVENLGMGLGSEELAVDYKRYFEYPNLLSAVTPQRVRDTVRTYYHAEGVQVYFMGKRPPDPAAFQALYRKPLHIARTFSDPSDERLDHGARLFMHPTPGKGIVGLAACLPVSQLDEAPDARGLNQMVTSLLLHGTTTRNYKQLLETCSSNGIVLSVSNHLEATVILAKCFPENLPLAVDLLNDVLWNPVFPQDHLANLVRTYRDSLDHMKDYPEQYGYYLWRCMLFGRQSKLLHRRGRKGDLSRMTVNALRQWHRRHFRPDRLTLVGLGEFDPQRLRDLVSRRFSQVTGELAIESSRDLLLSPTERHSKILRTGSDQSVLYLGGYGSPGSETENNTAFYVLSHILGGDLYSRLSMELREKLGAAYSCSFDFQAIDTLSWFAASAVVDREREEECLDAIRRILRDVAQKPVKEEELIIAKNAIRGQRLFDQESVSQQAEMLSMLLTMGYDYKFWQGRDARLQNVRRERLLELSERYFRADNEFVHVLA